MSKTWTTSHRFQPDNPVSKTDPILPIELNSMISSYIKNYQWLDHCHSRISSRAKSPREDDWLKSDVWSECFLCPLVQATYVYISVGFHISFVAQFVAWINWLENQRCRVNTVPLLGRFGTIVKDVAQVSSALGAQNLVPNQVRFLLKQFSVFAYQLIVALDQYLALVDWVEEGGPAASGVKFQIRREQILTADHTTVGTGLVEFVKSTCSRSFKDKRVISAKDRTVGLASSVPRLLKVLTFP